MLLSPGTGDGHQLWTRFYQGPRGSGLPASVAMSPDGTKVFVTGGSPGSNGTFSYATLAYQA